MGPVPFASAPLHALPGPIGCTPFLGVGHAHSTETDVSRQDRTMTGATSVITGYSLGLAGGAFGKLDVDTP